MPQQTIEKQIERMKRRIKHVERRVAEIKERHGRIESNSGTITKHGGWDLGYWEGKLATLEDTLDELKEIESVLTKKENVS